MSTAPIALIILTYAGIRELARIARLSAKSQPSTFWECRYFREISKLSTLSKAHIPLVLGMPAQVEWPE
jgi:hypothetical protein